MNITSAIVGLSILGVAAPGIMNVSLQPIIAQKRAANFAIAEAAAVTYSDFAQDKLELPEPPTGCSTEKQEAYTYVVTCEYGDKAYKAEAARAFSLMEPEGTGLRIYHDDDSDGFDDITGLMTHYAECYSGWKGVSSGTLKNNCDLGGRYVIPAYAHLYY